MSSRPCLPVQLTLISELATGFYEHSLPWLSCMPHPGTGQVSAIWLEFICPALIHPVMGTLQVQSVLPNYHLKRQRIISIACLWTGELLDDAMFVVLQVASFHSIDLVVIIKVWQHEENYPIRKRKGIAVWIQWMTNGGNFKPIPDFFFFFWQMPSCLWLQNHYFFPPSFPAFSSFPCSSASPWGPSPSFLPCLPSPLPLFLKTRVTSESVAGYCCRLKNKKT